MLVIDDRLMVQAIVMVRPVAIVVVVSFIVVFDGGLVVNVLMDVAFTMVDCGLLIVVSNISHGRVVDVVILVELMVHVSLAITEVVLLSAVHLVTMVQLSVMVPVRLSVDLVEMLLVLVFVTKVLGVTRVIVPELMKLGPMVQVMVIRVHILDLGPMVVRLMLVVVVTVLILDHVLVVGVFSDMGQKVGLLFRVSNQAHSLTIPRHEMAVKLRPVKDIEVCVGVTGAVSVVLSARELTHLQVLDELSSFVESVWCTWRQLLSRVEHLRRLHGFWIMTP